MAAITTSGVLSEDWRKRLNDKRVMPHFTQPYILVRVAQEHILVVLIIGFHYGPGGLSQKIECKEYI